MRIAIGVPSIGLEIAVFIIIKLSTDGIVVEGLLNAGSRYDGDLQHSLFIRLQLEAISRAFET